MCDQRKKCSTQKYLAGSTTIFIHESGDLQGFDTAGGITTGIRVLPTEIWYPVDPCYSPCQLKPAYYRDYFFGNLSAFQQYLNLSGITLDSGDFKSGTTQAEYDAAVLQRFNSPRQSFLNAPISQQGPFPVVVMQHNNGRHRTAFNEIGEILACAGYIALAWDVTGNSYMSQVANDPNYPPENVGLVPIDPTYNNYPQSTDLGSLLGGFLFAPPDIAGELGILFFVAIEEYRLDTISVISQLPDFNNGTDPYTNGFFRGSMLLDKIAYMGQSVGSITGRVCLGTIPELSCGFFNVPVGNTDYTHRFIEISKTTGIDYVNPLRETNTSFAWQYDHIWNPETKPAYYLLAAQDGVTQFFNGFIYNPGFMDMNPTEENPAPDVQRAFLYGLGPSFYGELADTYHDYFNYGNATQSLFPEIANYVYQQIWHPEFNYRVLPGCLGYKILRRKLISFLNVYLQGEAACLPTLLECQKYLTQLARNEKSVVLPSLGKTPKKVIKKVMEIKIPKTSESYVNLLNPKSKKGKDGK